MSLRRADIEISDFMHFMRNGLRVHLEKYRRGGKIGLFTFKLSYPKNKNTFMAKGPDHFKRQELVRIWRQRNNPAH